MRAAAATPKMPGLPAKTAGRPCVNVLLTILRPIQSAGVNCRLPVSVAVGKCPSFRLVGRSFLAFVLTPEPPFDQWLRDFDLWIERSEGVFCERPVVLDLSKLSLDSALATDLLMKMRVRDIRVIAVEGIDPAWLGPNLSPLQGGNGMTRIVEMPQAPQGEPPPPQRAPVASLLIDAPVRSGQSVFYPQGDVTITGSLASGAEVAAGGSIHVYGSLRGRAIAGSMGNRQARIFCRSLDAELLAIAGLYRTADDLGAEVLNRDAEVWLDGSIMRIRPQGQV